MPFIEDDDYIILFDVPDHVSERGGHQIPLESMKRFREAGVKTVLQLLSWRQIEKKMGHRDWSETDGFVAKGRAAGMKTLLMTYDLALTCAPPDWYLRGASGLVLDGHEIASCLSIWNREAQAYGNAFIREACERYSAPDVCCISALQREGEWVLPPRERAYFDESALADFRRVARSRYGDDLDRFNAANRAAFCDWESVRPSRNFESDTAIWLRQSIVRRVADQQRIFAPYHGEIWGMLQHVFDWDSGNFCSDAIYETMRRELDAKLYNIQFVYFPHDPRIKRRCLGDAEIHGMPTFGGSEWAEGLAANTPRAIAQGLRGLITAPMHPYTGHRSIERWMVDAFANSIRMWKAGEEGLALERDPASGERFRPRLRRASMG